MSLLALLLAAAHPALAASQPISGKVASFPYSGSLTCPAPPANWEPTTATVAQLRFYGLPLPAAHSGHVYQMWVDHMRHATQRLCTPGVASNIQIPRNNVGPDLPNGDFWSGYDVINGNFDEISGDWTVPCYSGTDYFQQAVERVGIGGLGSNTKLWQAGTETDPSQKYRFWYEAVPKNKTIVYSGPSVGCGNHVSVEVDYNYSVSGMAYLLMQNYSNGQYWSWQESFTPNETNAEWIVERPGCPSGNFALTHITNVNWSAAQAANTNTGNVGQPISYYAYTQLNMYQNGVDLSDNSGLGTGGGSFTTYYHNSGYSNC